jgi:hypothetical protein
MEQLCRLLMRPYALGLQMLYFSTMLLSKLLLCHCLSLEL